MDLNKEAAAKLKVIIECNAEREAEWRCDPTDFNSVYDYLLGWDEYNYGGIHREHQRDVANAIVELARSQA